MALHLGVGAAGLGTLVSGVALVLGLLYVYLTWNYDFWRKRGVKHMQPELFFGTMKEVLLGRNCDGVVLTGQYNMFPGEKFIGGFRMRRPFLLLRDLDLIKTVLVRDFDSFHDRVFPVDEESMPLSTHLFSLQGKRWRALRSKLTPAFTSGKMRLMFQLMSDCSHKLVQALESPAKRGASLEMREAIALFTTDVIGSCALGMQLNAIANPDSEFRRVGRAVFAPTWANKVRRLTLLFAPRLARLLRLTVEGAAANAFITRTVREMVAHREAQGVARGDFIDLLLQLKRTGRVREDTDQAEDARDRVLANALHTADDINMTDSLLAAQVGVFFLAGFETSSTASSFALYELALHADIQDRLRAEVDQAMEENGGTLTYDAILGMKYMDMVWNESLRKYPPLSDLVRQVTKEYRIAGTDLVLPKGLWVDIPIMAIHHDPAYFPEPERFDPLRFTEAARAARAPFAYLPFGEGPRICIAMRFGILQGKLALAVLLSKYRFSPCERTRIPMQIGPSSLVTMPKDGIWLKIEPR